MQKLLKLNLGCGFGKKEGYLNCDWSEDVSPDKIVNLNKRLPFDGNSVDEILLSHVLEHFQDPLKLIKEFYRVCKNKAIIKIYVPYFSHESAFSMLDHYHRFTWTSFDALEKGHPCHWQSVGSFVILKKNLRLRRQMRLFSFFNLFPRLYQDVFCWIFPAKELYVELQVLK